jgi:hypothetical protein
MRLNIGVIYAKVNRILLFRGIQDTEGYVMTKNPEPVTPGENLFRLAEVAVSREVFAIILEESTDYVWCLSSDPKRSPHKSKIFALLAKSVYMLR